MATEPQFCSWEQAVRWLRDQPDKHDLVLASYYDDPLIGAAMRYERSDEWLAILAQLVPNKAGKVLDVGAGRGIASYAFARAGYEVTALEPDDSDLVGSGAIRMLARDESLPIQVVQAASESIPIADGTFDVVFGRAVLHHTRDLAAACREFYRVLKPGGRLVAVREHVISRPQDLPAFFDLHPLHNLYGGENALLLRQYEACLHAAGFVIRKVIGPLTSPINHAPHTRATLQAEAAARLSPKSRVAAAALAGLFRLPGVWPLAAGIAQIFDGRPGRLYSFVADRT
jgi:SAM-dependent methyltransferase